ncbi:MAG TPA: hypothetical protein VGK20_13360 [Candidatus Binatia bacterium]|jgi:hypothetical protein
MRQVQLLAMLVATALCGCAGIDFDSTGPGLTYYEPRPYLFVTTTRECVSTATVISIPDRKKTMKFRSGYGSSDLSATFSGGMVTAVGQKVDTKIPETITAVSSLATAAGGLGLMEAGKPAPGSKPKAAECTPAARLYAIENGVPGKEIRDLLPAP